MNWEDKIFCLDCGKDLTEINRWKGEDRFRPSHHICPNRYCDDCKKKALDKGYIFRPNLIGEIQKTSPAIEQLCAESILAWNQSVLNQRF